MIAFLATHDNMRDKTPLDCRDWQDTICIRFCKMQMSDMRAREVAFPYKIDDYEALISSCSSW